MYKYYENKYKLELYKILVYYNFREYTAEIEKFCEFEIIIIIFKYYYYYLCYYCYLY